MEAPRTPAVGSQRVGAVTSADVARQAGVSRGAVSQILNGRHSRFAASTRARVEKAALELGYTPSFAGRTLARGRSDVVVALVPRTTFGGHLQTMLETMGEELARRGLVLVTRYSTAGAESLDRLLAALQPVAVLPISALEPEQHEVLHRRGTPTVGSAPPPGPPDLNWRIGDLQARHLVAHGYRHLAFADLTDARQNVYGPARVAGFRAACDDLGLSEPAIRALPLAAAPMIDYLRGLEPSTGIACYNDEVALVLLSAAHHLGVEVPRRLGLIGVDDTALGRAVLPRITSVGYDAELIARRLVQAILATVGATQDETLPPVKLTVAQGGTT